MRDYSLDELKPRKTYPRDWPLKWIEADDYLDDLPETRENRKWRKKAEKRRLAYGPEAVCLIRTDTMEFLQ